MLIQHSIVHLTTRVNIENFFDTEALGVQCTPKCGTVAVVVDSVPSVGRIIHSKRKENCGLLKKG